MPALKTNKPNTNFFAVFIDFAPVHAVRRSPFAAVPGSGFLVWSSGFLTLTLTLTLTTSH
jgi:hypothetical protein